MKILIFLAMWISVSARAEPYNRYGAVVDRFENMLAAPTTSLRTFADQPLATRNQLSMRSSMGAINLDWQNVRAAEVEAAAQIAGQYHGYFKLFVGRDAEGLFFTHGALNGAGDSAMFNLSRGNRSTTGGGAAERERLVRLYVQQAVARANGRPIVVIDTSSRGVNAEYILNALPPAMRTGFRQHNMAQWPVARGTPPMPQTGQSLAFFFGAHPTWADGAQAYQFDQIRPTVAIYERTMPRFTYYSDNLTETGGVVDATVRNRPDTDENATVNPQLAEILMEDRIVNARNPAVRARFLEIARINRELSEFMATNPSPNAVLARFRMFLMLYPRDAMMEAHFRDVVRNWTFANHPGTQQEKEARHEAILDAFPEIYGRAFRPDRAPLRSLPPLSDISARYLISSHGVEATGVSVGDRLAAIRVIVSRAAPSSLTHWVTPLLRSSHQEVIDEALRLLTNTHIQLGHERADLEHVILYSTTANEASRIAAFNILARNRRYWPGVLEGIRAALGEGTGGPNRAGLLAHVNQMMADPARLPDPYIPTYQNRSVDSYTVDELDSLLATAILHAEEANSNSARVSTRGELIDLIRAIGLRNSVIPLRILSMLVDSLAFDFITDAPFVPRSILELLANNAHRITDPQLLANLLNRAYDLDPGAVAELERARTAAVAALVMRRHQIDPTMVLGEARSCSLMRTPVSVAP